MVERDDSDLVAAAQTGDRDALDALLRRHQPRLWSLCRRLTGNDADAADALQECLISIVRALARFDGRSSFSTWSYRIATNAALDELRRRRRRPLPDADHVDDGHRTDDRPGVADRVSDRLTIDAALADLPDDFRRAVVLRDVLGLDYAEIAEVLGIPAGTVRSRIARGRARLADQLAPGNRAPDTDRPRAQP